MSPYLLMSNLHNNCNSFRNKHGDFYMTMNIENMTGRSVVEPQKNISYS